MEYVYLALAVFCCVGQVISSKEYQRCVPPTMTTAVGFYLVSSLLSALIFAAKISFRISYSGFSLWISLALAAVMLAYQLVTIRILSLGNVAVYSMFLMLGGMILPFLYGVIFLHEALNWQKILGIVLLSLFLILQVAGRSDRSLNRRGEFYALCFLMFVINGVTSILTKMHQVSTSAVDTESFTVLRSVFSLGIGGIAFGTLFLGNKNRKQRAAQLRCAFGLRAGAASVLSAIVSALGSFFLLVAALRVPASVQYPVVSGGTIVLSAGAAYLFYRERPDRKSLICLLGAFAATFLFLW